MGGVVKKVKKVVKKVTKVVKKVVKGVGKVAKKVWKGVKGAVKKIGKAVKKMGPLASIAIGFIPGFQGLWANAGIWGAMGKGAITGFITSGGKLKGALIGAAGGGLGYAANAGIDAYQKGYSSLGESASISDKIIAGFGSVGNSTVEGVSNMYKSAGDMLTGDFSKINYLDDTGRSIYTEGTAKTSNVALKKSFGYEEDKSLFKPGTDDHDAWLSRQTDEGTVLLKNAKTYMQEAPSTSYGEMKGFSQRKMMEASMKGEAFAVDQAKAFGYDAQVGKDFYKDFTQVPYDSQWRTVGDISQEQQMREIYNYATETGTGLNQAKELWMQTGGPEKAMSFDYKMNLNTGQYDYMGMQKGSGLQLTSEAAAGGTPTYISDPVRAKEAAKKNKAPNIADSLKSLLGSKGDAGTSLPFSTGDTGDQYEASGGSKAVGGEYGTGLGFAEGYGGALDPRQYTEQQGRVFKSLLG